MVMFITVELLLVSYVIILTHARFRRSSVHNIYSSFNLLIGFIKGLLQECVLAAIVGPTALLLDRIIVCWLFRRSLSCCTKAFPLSCTSCCSVQNLHVRTYSYHTFNRFICFAVPSTRPVGFRMYFSSTPFTWFLPLFITHEHVSLAYISYVSSEFVFLSFLVSMPTYCHSTVLKINCYSFFFNMIF